MERFLKLPASGDRSARTPLLALRRDRLRLMVAVRLEDRLSACVDPSDVVQEAMLQATQQLSDYLRGTRLIAFYTWLRQLALRHSLMSSESLIDADLRAVEHEAPVTDHSAQLLVEHLATSQATTTAFSASTRISYQIFPRM